MDVKCPKLMDSEATRIVCTQEYNQPVIIAMTANAMAGDREECIRAGMSDYTGKPPHWRGLMNLLEKWHNAREVSRPTANSRALVCVRQKQNKLPLWSLKIVMLQKGRWDIIAIRRIPVRRLEVICLILFAREFL